MKKIEAIIRPAKVGDVYAALGNAGCPGLTISEIEGQGKQKGVEQEFRGKKYRTSLMTKAKIEIIANDEDVERLVDTICEPPYRKGGRRKDLRLSRRRCHSHPYQGARRVAA